MVIINIDTRPNIILFMVDDMGWQDTSLTQLLKNSGYHTIHCGKAHWGAIDRDMRFYQKYIDAGLSEKEAGYASLIEGMDKSLGDLPLHTHNAPLNSGKGSAYEGGVRVPMIVKWPGRVKPDTKTHNYLIIEDFFPTILDIAQVKKNYSI